MAELRICWVVLGAHPDGRKDISVSELEFLRDTVVLSTKTLLHAVGFSPQPCAGACGCGDEWRGPRVRGQIKMPEPLGCR